MANFFDTVLAVLKQDDRFFAKDGAFLRNAVYEAAMKMDTCLLRLLLNNEETSKRFFADVDGVKVFDKIGFGWVINNRQFLPDSYTRFKNKIGLADSKGNLISESGDVELVFPYKDCVLEGGQTKEDQKRSEIFYNETLAPDEVDRLLYPKVLVNAKRYTSEGEEATSSFNDGDNLIIKGNNLLSEASLLRKYEGKIKLVYLDPPYNTETDANTFLYNNSFNHSSWMTFMKNRIVIAKRLLRDDGSICLAIDDAEYAHLKLLCDEIFGRENYIGTIVVQSNPRGRTINSQFATCHEYALFYAKNINLAVINKQELTSEQEDEFDKSDDKGTYRELPFQRSGGTSTPTDRPNSEFTLYYSEIDNNIIAVGGKRISDASSEYVPQDILTLNDGNVVSHNPTDFLANHPNVVPLLPIDVLGKRRVWRWSDRDKILKAASEHEFVFSVNKSKIVVKLKDRAKEGRKPKTIWNDSRYDASANGTILLKNIFDGNKVFTYPKSLYTVKDIIKMMTSPDSGDILLDIFAGSGTTAHAILELNKEDNGDRKFILCEQMDYVQTVTLERILRVENTLNISVPIVFSELAKLNQIFIDEIQDAETEDQLLSLYNKIISTGFISHKINPADIDTNCAEYQALSFSDKKRFLLELLDKNLLYVNYCDMDDEEYAISEEDKAFTRSFYGE